MSEEAPAPAPALEEAPAPAVEEAPAPALEEAPAPVQEGAPVTSEEKSDVPVLVEDIPPVSAPEEFEVISVPEEVVAAPVVPDITPENLGASVITEFFEEVVPVITEDKVSDAPPSIVEAVKRMAPQKYADLGKEARDLISKNFHFGAVKLEAKTKGESGVSFTTEGSHNTDTGNVAASLESKFKYAPYGVTFTKKWNTDNIISNIIAHESTLIDGLKIDLDTTFAPFTGKKSAKVKTAYQHSDFFHGTADVDFADLTGPTLHGSGVLAYKGWHGGCQASYDIANSKLLDNKFSLTYKNGDLVVHTGIVNASNYVGSIHHQVNKDISVAALLDWASDLSTFTLCGKYAVGDDAFVKAKVDNNLHVGLAYAQKLRPSIWLTMSGLLNAKSLEQGGHKVGLSLNFEA